MEAKPKEAANYQPRPHSHQCPGCGRVWKCSLQLAPEQKKYWAARKPPINVEKMFLQCWWEDDSRCAQC